MHPASTRAWFVTVMWCKYYYVCARCANSYDMLHIITYIFIDCMIYNLCFESHGSRSMTGGKTLPRQRPNEQYMELRWAEILTGYAIFRCDNAQPMLAANTLTSAHKSNAFSPEPLARESWFSQFPMIYSGAVCTHTRFRTHIDCEEMIYKIYSSMALSLQFKWHCTNTNWIGIAIARAPHGMYIYLPEF